MRFTILQPQFNPRGRTFIEFKMMLPGPFNAFNTLFKEAMLTTVIRKDIVPAVRKIEQYYNVSSQYNNC